MVVGGSSEEGDDCAAGDKASAGSDTGAEAALRGASGTGSSAGAVGIGCIQGGDSSDVSMGCAWLGEKGEEYEGFEGSERSERSGDGAG